MWNYVQFLLFHVGLRNLRFSVYRVAQLGQHFVQTHSKKNSEDSMGGLWTPSPTLTLWALHWPGQNAEGRLRSGDDGRASRCSEVVSNIDDVPVDTRYSRSRCTSVGNIFDSAGDGHVCRLFEIFEEDLETNRLRDVLFRCRWSPQTIANVAIKDKQCCRFFSKSPCDVLSTFWFTATPNWSAKQIV